eukprot:PITA_04229
MDSLLLSIGFIRCKSDPNVCLRQHDDSLSLIVLHVDDLQMTRNLTSAIDSKKSTLHDRFSMTDLGLLHYFLGFEVSQSTLGIKMAQSKYASNLLVHFQMTKCKLATSPFLLGIRFEDVDCPLSLIRYTDSDWAGDGTDCKSTSGYVFSFGSGPFCWSNKKQSMIALSMAETEYRGVANAATQAV